MSKLRNVYKNKKLTREMMYMEKTKHFGNVLGLFFIYGETDKCCIESYHTNNKYDENKINLFNI